MYQIDFHKPEAVHFIGIGGISMSGLAEILLDRGFTVTGSDSQESELTRHLEEKGARVVYEQKAENLTDGIDVVVFTAAVHPDNPEYAQAAAMGLPILSRAELLGQVMKNYKNSIAVSGTHGKTTTTSMMAEVLLHVDMDPTISVGGILKSIGGNIRVGGPDLFLTEACEYTNSFLSFYPTVAIILNIEADHLDFFKDLEEIRRSFRLFAERIPENGLLVINNDIENVEEITRGLACRVVTFGQKGSNYEAYGLEFDEMARPRYLVKKNGVVVSGVDLAVPGAHNVYNSLAVTAACAELGIDLDDIYRGLKRFRGTKRRFEKKGEFRGITIIDDYAHHPQEIRVTLETAKHRPHEKLWVVFQPHTYTRTKAFLDEFAEALSIADEVILADIYAARETDTLGISSADLARKLEEKGKKAHYFPSFREIEKFILYTCKPDDLLITMGAGDVVKVGEELLDW